VEVLANIICCFKTEVLLNNKYIIIPCGPQYLFGPRLGCAREYGSVMVDQKIVSDHEKCAVFVIATYYQLLLRFIAAANAIAIAIDTGQISRMSKLCPGNLNLVRYLHQGILIL
jgi:hypothetical protein